MTPVAETVAKAGLSVRQLDWVDQWLKVWCKGVSLDRRFLPEMHQYAVDLAQSTGPVRVDSSIDLRLPVKARVLPGRIRVSAPQTQWP